MAKSREPRDFSTLPTPMDPKPVMVADGKYFDKNANYRTDGYGMA